MAGLGFVKMLLPVALLLTPLRVTHALAGEEEQLLLQEELTQQRRRAEDAEAKLAALQAHTLDEERNENWRHEGGEEESCKEGEEKVKGECCPESMIDEEEDGEKVCFEAPSHGSIATAFTLIGSFTFMISLFFAMHWPDKDMQKYAYEVISETVSIFSAVLMFQCLNGLVEEFIIERFGMYGWWEVLADFIQTSIWYTIMQLTIANVSGSLQDESERDKKLNRPKEESEEVVEEKEHVEMNCACYGTVLAHITGFSSINVWTGLQCQPPFNSSPLMAFIPVLIAVLGTLLLQRITDFCRERIIQGDGKKDFFEEKWDEECEEAENDVMSLTCSVLLVNAIRFAINGIVEEGVGCLPNQEQKDEGEKCEELEKGARTVGQVLYLFLAGVLFVVLLFITEMVRGQYFPEEDEDEEADEEGSPAGQGEEEGEEEKSLSQEVIERLVDSFVLTLSMSFCWCTFHGNTQLLKVMSSFLRDERQEASLAVIIGLEVSYLSWIIMCILDKIQDLDEKYTPKAIDKSIGAVIFALSLLIGFAWEQTFDASVDSLANSFRKDQGKHAPSLVKFVVGSFCCTIVFLAWKWYILEYVVKKGWNYHIAFNKRELILAAEKINEKLKHEKLIPKHMRAEDPIIAHHILPTLKNDPSTVVEYQALPGGDPESKVVAKNKKLMELLKQSDAEKLKLQNLLNSHMESMLSSFKAMNDTVTRIESA